MWFKLDEILIDYDEKYIDEIKIKSFFSKAIELAKGLVNIDEIQIEDDETSYFMLLKNGLPDEWDWSTIQFVKLLEDYYPMVMYSDEDYGDNIDMIIVNYREAC